jgi:multicomponent Na+:H+ antiporter subunit C
MMIDNPCILYLIAGTALFAIGLSGVFADVPALRRIIAINVMGNGVFLVLIALAARAAGDRMDPVPQAMVLTGIVVAVCATGLALTLADRYQRGRTTDDKGDHS